MVYRGTWGRDPEKKGEDVFPPYLVLVTSLSAPNGLTQASFGGSPWDPHFVGNRRFQGYTPEDVLPPGPQATSELDVLYHSVMHDKCVGGALPL